MAVPIHAPRVNNNDDFVLVVEIEIARGDFVSEGQLLATVETDKSIVEVTAESDGHVLDILCQPEDQLPVGSVMLWLGDSLDEKIPESRPTDMPGVVPLEHGGKPTAKARALIEEHGLDVNSIAHAGDRIGVSDVEAHLSGNLGASAPERQDGSRSPFGAPSAPGVIERLDVEAMGMMKTVCWHRDEAAPGYVEIPFDQAQWDRRAADYAEEHRLMLSPLLPLLAHRLAEIARDSGKINSTIYNGQRFSYDHVNVGFTVQGRKMLYLVVVNDAGAMSARKFINALGELQQQAIGRKLSAENSQGATVAFTSMAKWGVSRHVPILPPYTSLIIAHSGPNASASSGDGGAVLGASYDHRVLSGSDVVEALKALASPPAS